MDNNFLVIGGDLRIVKLVNMLSEKNVIYTYGLEKTEEIDDNENIVKCKKYQTIPSFLHGSILKDKGMCLLTHPLAIE